MAVLISTQARGQTVSTTTYTYNADGALTRVVEQVDGGAPTTTYLTWDNFLPDAGDPSTGTVGPGNGNLVGQGAAPGSSDRAFIFDAQDRLMGFSDGGGAVGYSFHPTWLMAASSLDGGDARYFYYDNASIARMTSIEDDGSGLISAELGSVRSVSDGTLQVLLSPRKDVSGVYDPNGDSFSPYRYDPYGEGETSGEGATGGYDLDDNPSRYAGEYRDPTWGGYYLRARWYDPGLHNFISRDPVANLNRYGYTDGNPINRVDPSGRKYRAYKKFMRPLGNFLAKRSGDTFGIPVTRIVFGSVITPLELIADPAGFYHQQIAGDYGLRLVVALGTVALDAYTDDLLAGDKSLTARFLTVAERATVGLYNAGAAATSHNFQRFNTQIFYQGLEFSAGSIAQAQLASLTGGATVSQLQDKLLPWDGHPSSADFARTFRVSLAYPPKKTASADPSGRTRAPLAALARYQEGMIPTNQPGDGGGGTFGMLSGHGGHAAGAPPIADPAAGTQGEQFASLDRLLGHGESRPGRQGKAGRERSLALRVVPVVGTPWAAHFPGPESTLHGAVIIDAMTQPN